jgi:hypothetical protein
VYFCDRNLGRRFGEALRQQGLAAELHDHHFPPDTPDQDLLRQVAAQEWVMLTLDKQMRYRPAEKAAILRYRARVIMLPLPKSPEKGWLLALAGEFAKAQGKVQNFLQKTPPPFLARFRIDAQRTGSKRYRVEEIPLQ